MSQNRTKLCGKLRLCLSGLVNTSDLFSTFLSMFDGHSLRNAGCGNRLIRVIARKLLQAGGSRFPVSKWPDEVTLDFSFSLDWTRLDKFRLSI